MAEVRSVSSVLYRSMVLCCSHAYSHLSNTSSWHWWLKKNKILFSSVIQTRCYWSGCCGTLRWIKGSTGYRSTLTFKSLREPVHRVKYKDVVPDGIQITREPASPLKIRQVFAALIIKGRKLIPMRTPDRIEITERWRLCGNHHTATRKN